MYPRWDIKGGDLLYGTRKINESNGLIFVREKLITYVIAGFYGIIQALTYNSVEKLGLKGIIGCKLQSLETNSF